MEFEGNHRQCARQAVPGIRGTRKGSSWTDPSLGFCHEGAVRGREGSEVHCDENDGIWQEGLMVRVEVSWVGGWPGGSSGVGRDQEQSKN